MNTSMKKALRASLSIVVLTIITTAYVAAEEGGAGTDVSLFKRIIDSGAVEWVLILLSIIGTALGIQRLMTIKQDILVPDGLVDDMHNIFAEGVDDEGVEEAVNMVSGDDSMLGQVCFAMLDKRDLGFDAMREAAENVASAEHNKYMTQISILSLFAGIGPMLGLLGTVTGMIKAFFQMAGAGGAVDPAMLADSIGGAMITTATGLIIAIPMLIIFFFLRARVNRCVMEGSVLSAEVLDYFRPAAV